MPILSVLAVVVRVWLPGSWQVVECALLLPLSELRLGITVAVENTMQGLESLAFRGPPAPMYFKISLGILHDFPLRTDRLVQLRQEALKVFKMCSADTGHRAG